MSAMNSEVPIAIIGMSCRFSGDATDPEKLWKLVADGRSGWSEIPSSRFNAEGFWHPFSEKTNTMNVKGGHFLDEDVGLFDAAFFGLPAETAASLDPQFRLQLESTYEALENAGIKLEDVAGSNTSMFGGTFFRDYHDSGLRDPETLPRFLLVGVGSAMASNRISHFYDLRGASMSLDTGCSTTLIALHQACQNLRAGESDMSIVGGANVILNPDNFVVMTSLRLISPSGKSYAFDDRASGYGRGEGSATVVLKRLDDAIRDGDPIRAVIRGSGSNQDGRTDTITTPSQHAQMELMKRVYETSGLDPRDTTYVEAHGTGTPTGDPIECRAIASVFNTDRPRNQPLLIGSVKTNIGHTETASGLASIIKVALALEKEQIPPSINFENPNPNIDLDGWNLKVPTEIEAWPAYRGVQRASVNNFGYGGANAHIILESYRSYLRSTGRPNGSNNIDTNGNKHSNCYVNTDYRTNCQTHGPTNGSTNGLVKGHMLDDTHLPSRVFMFSARDEQSAIAMATNLKDYLSTIQVDNEAEFLDNLAYTLGERRSVFNWITAQPAKSIHSLIDGIELGKMKPTRTRGRPRVGFVFTGQGAQWYAMGRELIAAYPIFRDCLVEADAYLKEFGCTWSLMEELLKDAESTRVNEPVMSMPLCAAVQIALVRLLRSWGVEPSAVTSHSSGEIAAACAAGVLTLKDAMAIVFARGSLTGDASIGVARKVAGGMLAVGLGADEVTAKYLPRISSGRVVLACLNSPTSITASGDVPGIVELEAMLKKDNVFVRRLKVDAAYHSHHMVAIQDTYLSWLQKLLYADGQVNPGVVYSSPTTGTRLTSGKILSRPEHWVRSLVNPVQFVKAFTQMCLGEDFKSSGTSDVDIVIEVGPHSALGGPIAEIVGQPEFGGIRIPYYSCLVRKTNAIDTMQSLACNLIREGHSLDIKAINFPCGRQCVRVLPDLPSYPWNHNTRHWSETRYNKSHRQRLEAPHDLLGSLTVGTNPFAPSWRLIIRTLDMPWVRDHVIQGTMLYPGGGFLCMAIEGACQMAATTLTPKQHIAGIELRDVDIMAALVVPDTTEGIEMQLNIRPASQKALYAKDYKEFHIYSITNDNKWTENCKGLIAVEIAEGDEVSANQKRSHLESPWFVPRKMSDYRKRLDSRDIYAAMHAVGIQHGPSFQNLREMRAGYRQSISVLEVADTAAVMPYQHQHEHIIHPVTLDTIFQSAYAALSSTGSKITATLPRSIKQLWIANDISTTAGQRFRAHSDVNRVSPQTFDTDITVTTDHDNSSEVVLAIKGFVFQSIGGTLSGAINPWENDKFSEVRWAPDLTLAKPENLAKQLDGAHTEVIADKDSFGEIQKLCINFISAAVEAMTPSDVEQLHPPQKEYYNWMKSRLDLVRSNKLASDGMEWVTITESQKVALIETVKAAGVSGELVACLGPHLRDILKGTVNALELAQENQLLSRYHSASATFSRSSQQVGELLKQFAHTNPRGRILEVNAGAGGITQQALVVLGTSESGIGPLATSYHFTDPSSQFFGIAKEKFAAWQDLVTYKKLDVGISPAIQGFENEKYDLIIANRVLSGNFNDSKSALENIDKLLRPRGRLILIEIVRDQLDVQFISGLLPDHRFRKISHPDVSQWDHLLREAGFGIQTVVHNPDNEDEGMMSVILASAPGSAPRFGSDVVIVVGDVSPPNQWLNQLKAYIARATGSEPFVQPLESAKVDDRLVIFLPELTNAILKDPTEAQFNAIKSLCIQSKGLIWVTRGGQVDSINIDASMHVGFLRCIRFEYHGKRLVSLDLDPTQDLWSPDSATDLTSVFTKVFDYSVDDPMQDFEFVVRGGIIMIPRYYKDVERNRVVFSDPANTTGPSLEPLHQDSRQLRLVCEKSGVLESLAFNDNPEARQEVPLDFVEIEPRAFGLNYRDVMAAHGQLQEEEPLGSECSGVITKVGAIAADHGFKVGDRVAALLRGHISSIVRAHWSSTVRLPETMSFDTAATVPMAYTTAYASIVNAARLKKGETILIHTAAGGFGQAAVTLARRVGAKIFVTVGSDDKKSLIMKKYGILDSQIFSSRDASFVSGILAVTHGRGVDVILNTLPGALMQESFNCLAPFGRFVEVRKRNHELDCALDMSAFKRGVSFISLDMAALTKHSGEEISGMLDEIIRLLKERVIEPISPVIKLALSSAQEAFRIVEAGQHMGKVILTINPQDIVPVIPRIPKAEFRSDVSYLVVGGLGGLGKAICYWMVDHGAKNLIVLSRSAGSKANSMILDIEKRGCKVKAVGCDISDEADLAQTLEQTKYDMPPIRGVFQGAMVLQDSILEQMTVKDYITATRPKVQGTWNLHKQFEKDELDFFVILSSLSAVIGFASQCNYSAGGTYEDALARYRALRGLPCVSIDIGVVLHVGVVAEHDAIEERLRKSGHTLLSEDDVLRAVESAIISPPASSQMMIGLNPGPGPHWEFSGMARDSRFSTLKYKEESKGHVQKASGSDLSGIISAAEILGEAIDAISKALGEKLMEIFMISEIIATDSLSEQGVDSLVAVELRNMLALKAGSQVSIFDIMSSSSIIDLAKLAAQKSSFIDPSLRG